jgi:hypothetical protein
MVKGFTLDDERLKKQVDKYNSARISKKKSDKIAGLFYLISKNIISNNLALL